MPVIESHFRSARLFGSGHAQTMLAAWRRRVLTFSYHRERLELPDGDFLDLDWAPRKHRRLVILTHGLEGHASDSYICGTAAASQQAGWDALAWNFRGCSGVPNRLVRFYHGGATDDLQAVIQHAAQFYSSIALVGFSLGGNLILKYLGESKPPPEIMAAAAISAPVDLASTVYALDSRWSNRPYLHRLLSSAKRKIVLKSQQFPDCFDVSKLESVRTFADFDNQFTATAHGFVNAEDYWTQCSSRQFLSSIQSPTLLLNALNDPMLSAESFPTPEAEASDHLVLEAPRSGGHLGFLDSLSSSSFWLGARIMKFFSEQASPPEVHSKPDNQFQKSLRTEINR